MYRVYTNPDQTWSVDEGVLSDPQEFKEVIFHCVGITKYNPVTGFWWLEFPNAQLIVVNSTAILR